MDRNIFLRRAKLEHPKTQDGSILSCTGSPPSEVIVCRAASPAQASGEMQCAFDQIMPPSEKCRANTKVGAAKSREETPSRAPRQRLALPRSGTAQMMPNSVRTKFQNGVCQEAQRRRLLNRARSAALSVGYLLFHHNRRAVMRLRLFNTVSGLHSICSGSRRYLA